MCVSLPPLCVLRAPLVSGATIERARGPAGGNRTEGRKGGRKAGAADERMVFCRRLPTPERATEALMHRTAVVLALIAVVVGLAGSVPAHAQPAGTLVVGLVAEP